MRAAARCPDRRQAPRASARQRASGSSRPYPMFQFRTRSRPSIHRSRSALQLRWRTTQGAESDGLTEFVGVINGDIAHHVFVEKSYTFDRVSLALYLPKFSTQAPRLVGVSLHGTATLITRNASGVVTSTATESYSKSWGLSISADVPQQVIINDYTDLVPA